MGNETNALGHAKDGNLVKWDREFFQDDVTHNLGPTALVSTSGFVRLYESDVIVVRVPAGTTNVTGEPVRLVYAVKNEVGTRSLVLPVPPYEPTFPTKRELNRIASIKGAKAQIPKHRRVPKKALVARTGFQQMCRLPCYRGTRPR
jgi:hypothetical protein